MLIERLLDGMSIDGTPFFEAGSHGCAKGFYACTMWGLFFIMVAARNSKIALRDQVFKHIPTL